MKPITIECKAIREGGTQVTIDDKTYNFQPNEEGRHVCDVSDKKHAQRFMAIPEAYQLYDEDDDHELDLIPPSEPEKQTGEIDDGQLLGAEEDGIQSDDQDDTENETKDESQESSDESQDDTDQGDVNGLIPEDKEETEDDTEQDESQEDSGQSEGYEGKTREELVAAYQEKFGSKPHHRWSDQKVIEKLNEEA
jgi:hypothetical protein